MHKVWARSIVFSIITLAFFALYTISFYNKADLYIWNKIFANASVLLISISMGIASYSYFFPKLTHFIEYRREIGIIGFFFVLLHGAIILAMPDRYAFPAYFLLPDSLLPFIFAVISTIILAIMAVISVQHIKHKMNPLYWRKMLRLGHIALIFGLLHFAFKSSLAWADWFATLFPIYPPPSFLAFVGGLLTILFRILMALELKR